MGRSGTSAVRSTVSPSAVPTSTVVAGVAARLTNIEETLRYAENVIFEVEHRLGLPHPANAGPESEAPRSIPEQVGDLTALSENIRQRSLAILESL
jgi:hypothetical protein